MFNITPPFERSPKFDCMANLQISFLGKHTTDQIVFLGMAYLVIDLRISQFIYLRDAWSLRIL